MGNGGDALARTSARRPAPNSLVLSAVHSVQVVYAIRIKANAVLERRIDHLLHRRVGRPSKKPEVSYASFEYRAKSWGHPRRVVAKVEWHAGELFPRVGFIVTNLNRHARNVVRFYNGRGTAEQWIKEGKCELSLETEHQHRELGVSSARSICFFDST